jgi:hypothetical protein
MGLMSDGAFQQMPQQPVNAAADSALEPRREEVLTYLRRHIHEGDLTLEEYGIRVERVLMAQSPQEILSATDGLPTLHDPVVQSQSQSQSQSQPQSQGSATGVKVDRSGEVARSKTMFSIFSEGKLKGRWRAGHSVSVLTLFGNATIDLRDAILTTDELLITGLVAFGSLQIIVPPGSNVDLDNLVLFGSKNQDDDHDDPLPGMPLIRVTSPVLFGEVTVKVRAKDDTKRSRWRRQSL